MARFFDRWPKLTQSDLNTAILTFMFMVLVAGSLAACGFKYPAMNAWRVDTKSLGPAMLATSGMAIFIPLFVRAKFSFGYLISFALFGTVVGFVWLSFFSQFQYPHSLARWSMVGALAAALVPLLFVDANISPLRLSRRALARIAALLVGFSLIVLFADASYGLAFGDPFGAMRNSITRPAMLNYLTGMVIGAILPYLFTYYASRGQRRVAICILLIALGYFPVVLNKTVLLLPLWLPFLFWLFSRFEPKIATAFALLLPMTAGFIDFAITAGFFPQLKPGLFGIVNLRLLAVPSLALDHYADFFAHHELTHFCQISVVRRLIGCPYGELGPALEAIYHNGNFNASFLATEGIASVGLTFAPLVALGCGLAISIGSLASRHLTPRFIAVSSGIAVLSLMNVPLSAALLTNGVGLLFLLWWITPAEACKPDSGCAEMRLQRDDPASDRSHSAWRLMDELNPSV